MNLATLVAGLLDAEGFGGILVRVRDFTRLDATPADDERERRAWGATRTIDMTGRKDVAPIDPQELERRLAAANAATVQGQLEAMRANAPEPAPAPERSLDAYNYVDLARERERRGMPAITIPDNRILD